MRPASRSIVISLALVSLIGAVPASAQQPIPDSSRRTVPAQRHDSVASLEAVEVRASATGRGGARGTNAIDAATLRLTPAGTSALKVIERLPGVNVQSADAFGMYEWSNRVTIRGFQTQQIGQTFDGLPLGDMSYGNFNGLGIGRAVDPDNLAAASVAQGSGALGTASSNNLGGVVQYVSQDPANEAGVDLRQLAGSSSALRTFLRANTGFRQLGAGAAMKGYVSVSRAGSDKWKGGGERFSRPLGDVIGDRSVLGYKPENWQDQVNAKLQTFVGAHTLTAYYDFSDKKESDYADLSWRRYQTSGRGWDQYSSWADARAAAASATPDEAYFYSAEGARKDHLGYVRGDFKLGESTRLVITPYAHIHRGAGDWHAPSYGASWSPDSIMFRQSQYENHRYGTTAQATTSIAGNKLEGGVWFEHNDVTNRRPRWRLQDYASGPAVNFDNLLRLDYDRTGKIRTTTLYLQNTSTLLADQLRLTYGAKYLHIGADFHSNGNTLQAPLFGDPGRPDLSVPTKGGVLPQVGAVYSATATEQLFASFSTNVNAFPYSPAGGVYATNPKAFAYFKDNAKPEHATTYELGIRTKRHGVEASLAGYDIDYRHRLIGVAVCPPTATCAASFGNVGAVTSRGAEGLLSWTIAPSLSWTSSAAYNRSTYDDDYRNGATLVRTAGKTVVDAPKLLASSELRLGGGNGFATFGGRYVGKRYFTYLNDMSVPSYAVFNAGAGYTVRRLGTVKNVSVQANVQNLFDKSYIGTIGSNGFTVSGDNQTLLAGAPRLVYVTIGTSF